MRRSAVMLSLGYLNDYWRWRSDHIMVDGLLFQPTEPFPESLTNMIVTQLTLMKLLDYRVCDVVDGRCVRPKIWVTNTIATHCVWLTLQSGKMKETQAVLVRCLIELKKE